MAFPIVETTSSGVTATGTTHSVPLPAGVATDNLILIAFSNGLDTATMTVPGDYTTLSNATYQATMNAGVCWKKAGASESNPSFTSAASVALSYVCYRISTWDTTSSPEAGTPASSAGDANPDPPSVTPSWGALDTLWVAIAHSDGAPTVSAIPASYGNEVSNTSTYTLATSRRELNAASENPGTYTFSLSDQWAANTVAVKPSAGGGGGGTKPMFRGS